MLPISLRPDGRRAVVVGGGSVAARKVESLLAAGFPVFIVAERIGDRLRRLLLEQSAECTQRRYESSDVNDAALIVAATDDALVNAHVVADARAARVLACDATQPERGDFTMAATVRIGDLTVSADSGGGSPAFSRRVVRDLAAALGSQYGDAARTLAQMRTHLRESFPPEERAAILRSLAFRPITELATMQPMTVVCASRRSPLAMIQSRAVAARLAEHGIATTILGVTTGGDRDSERPIDRLGSTGVFVSELETALRERRADYAVHSCKDLPSTLADDVRIAAISAREDARDAFCSDRYSSFESLPPGARVGTSSPRRRTQLAALRNDLEYADLRGNVETRLRKLREGDYAAVVLALAGLNRLHARAAHVVPFAADTIVPAVGQGALAVETRADDQEFAELLHSVVNDVDSELCVRCERAALAALHAGCSAPIGIHARLAAGAMIVDGAYACEDASIRRERIERRVTTLEEAGALGAELAARLQVRGQNAGVCAGER
jgi:hydroxymethylbilane synthase